MWAPRSRFQDFKTRDAGEAYKKLAEMLQQWTCRVHDRGLPRTVFSFFQGRNALPVIIKIENVSKWADTEQS